MALLEGRVRDVETGCWKVMTVESRGLFIRDRVIKSQVCKVN
jgi:hypothetical protein